MRFKRENNTLSNAQSAQLEYNNFRDITNKALKKNDLKINIEENSVEDNVNKTDVVQKFRMVPCYFGMSSDFDEFQSLFLITAKQRSNTITRITCGISSFQF